MISISELRQEVFSLKELVVIQNKEIERLKQDGWIEENSSPPRDNEKRLSEIEQQLAEQKASSGRITKLCLAAIRALEKLEDVPGFSGLKDGSYGSLDDASPMRKESSNDSIDASIGKLLCNEISKLNEMLIKVDDDIDALDERTNENQQDNEKLDKRMEKMEGNFLEMKQNLASLTSMVEETRQRSSEVNKTSLRKEIEAVLAKNNFATKHELHCNIESALDGLDFKDEIVNMVKSKEKVINDLEAQVNSAEEKRKERERGFTLEISEMKKEMAQFDELLKHEYHAKDEIKREIGAIANEMSSDLSQKNKKISELESYMKREIKQVMEAQVMYSKDDNRSVDEAKFNNRIERLGKEVSIMKQKITEFHNNLDEFSARQKNIEEKHGSLNKILGTHQEEIKKLSKYEKELDTITQKIAVNDNLCQDILNECQSKIDKTEIDDLKNGMEKERCKINYFQDKIMNIAKSVESVKIENNNMRDKFCSDIELNAARIKDAENKMENHEKIIRENSNALKDITTDSIHKIKDVAGNCLQIEKNIRSIKDKSILFDTQLQDIKKQITETRKKNEEEINSIMEEIGSFKSKGSSVPDELINNLKERLKFIENDFKNFKQDKKTTENENEERQLSLEGSVLDLRSYVEAVLTETNSQLNNIAHEVDATQEKVTKFAVDLDTMASENEIYFKHDILEKEESARNISQIRDVTENSVKELTEQFAIIKNEQQIAKSRDSGNEVNKLKEDLEKTLTEVLTLRNIASNNAHKVKELAEKQKEMTSLEDQSQQELSKMSTLLHKLDSRIESVDSTVQDRVVQIELLKDNEQNVKEKLSSSSAKQGELASKIEVVEKHLEALRKDSDTRQENFRKKLTEMIGNTEIRVSEAEDKIKLVSDGLARLTEIENNHYSSHEATLTSLKSSLDAESAAKMTDITKIKTETLELVAKFKKDLEALKTEMSLHNLENLKSTVNQTHEIHNKLISSMQKDVDDLMKEKQNVNAKLTQCQDQTDQLRKMVQEEQKKSENKENTLEERVKNVQMNIREIHEKMNTLRQEINDIPDINIMTTVTDDLKKQIDIVNEDSIKKMDVLESTLYDEIGKVKEQFSSGPAQEKTLERVDTVESKLETIQEVVDRINSESYASQSAVDKINQTLNLGVQNNSSSIKKIDMDLMKLTDSITALDDDVKNFKNAKLDCETCNIENMKTINDDVRNLITKTNQQKAKLIDVEAMVNFQERSLNKIDEDIKKINSSVFGVIANLEDKVESITTDVNIKQSSIMKRSDAIVKEFESFTLGRSRLESKFAQIDLKADSNEVNKLKSFVKDEVTRIQKEIKDVSTSVGNIKDISIRELDLKLQRVDNQVLPDIKQSISSLQTKDLYEIREKLERLKNSAESKPTRDLVDSKNLDKLEADLALLTSNMGRMQKDDLPSLTKEVETLKGMGFEDVKQSLNSLQTKDLTEVWEAIHGIQKINNQNSNQPLDKFVMRDEFAHVDGSVTRLLKITEDLQVKILNKKSAEDDTEPKKQAIENLAEINNKIGCLEKTLSHVEEEMRKKVVMNKHQDNQLSVIEKRRRGWEGAMEKAEEMAQIFDSLIITNDRPYVSCGIDERLTGPGLVFFNQFELINKIEWEIEDGGFTLLEPGVYLLYIAGSLNNCIATVQLVSEQLEADLVSLRAPATGTFRSKMTVFTIEDDDRDAEKVVVELHTIAEGEMAVDTDFSLLMYKISEVSSADSGDAWRPISN